MTDGAIRAMPPIISPGFFHSSVLHILSEAGVGMDLIMSWNLHTEVAKGTAYFCPWSFIWFISRKKVKGYQPQKINWSSTLKSSICSQDSTFHISNAYSVWRFRKIFFVSKKNKINSTTQIFTVNILMCIVLVFLPPTYIHMCVHTHTRIHINKLWIIHDILFDDILFSLNISWIYRQIFKEKK